MSESACPYARGPDDRLYSEAHGELQRDAEGPERGDVEGLGHPQDGPEGGRRRRRDGRELGNDWNSVWHDGPLHCKESCFCHVGPATPEDLEVTVLSDLCADLDQRRHDACMDAVFPTLARVMPSDEWLAALGRPGGGGGPGGSPQKTAAGALRGLL